MKWGLILSNPSRRNLAKASKADAKAINHALTVMCNDVFEGDVRRLRGTRDIIRRRVGAWRILYRIDLERRIIIVVNIKRRDSHTY
jgi:mRNA-degrading endonuclease RelE of RelBE toxin-antitoxin system